MLMLAAASAFVPAPLYPLYCRALRTWARRRLELAEDEGVPIYALPEGGMHDAIGIGAPSFGLVLASRAALRDRAWPGMRAHLLSHVRRADGWRASAIVTAMAVGGLWQPLASGVLGLLCLALFLRAAERRADAAAAKAVQGDGDAVEAFARYTATDGALRAVRRFAERFRSRVAWASRRTRHPSGGGPTSCARRASARFFHKSHARS